jgi:hypothetical protein
MVPDERVCLMDPRGALHSSFHPNFALLILSFVPIPVRPLPPLMFGVVSVVFLSQTHLLVSSVSSNLLFFCIVTGSLS